MPNFVFAELTPEQKTFLDGYTPKDKHFTSFEEIEQIKNVLGLSDQMGREEIRAVRNSVVRYYSGKDRSLSMMSVTAAIDYQIAGMGYMP